MGNKIISGDLYTTRIYADCTAMYYHQVETGDGDRFSCFLPFSTPINELSGDAMLNVFDYIIGRFSDGTLVYFGIVTGNTQLHCYSFSGSSCFSSAVISEMDDQVDEIAT